MGIASIEELKLVNSKQVLDVRYQNPHKVHISISIKDKFLETGISWKKWSIAIDYVHRFRVRGVSSEQLSKKINVSKKKAFIMLNYLLHIDNVL